MSTLLGADESTDNDLFQKYGMPKPQNVGGEESSIPTSASSSSSTSNGTNGSVPKSNLGRSAASKKILNKTNAVNFAMLCGSAYFYAQYMNNPTFMPIGIVGMIFSTVLLMKD